MGRGEQARVWRRRARRIGFWAGEAIGALSLFVALYVALVAGWALQ